jgi:hypothetical protein
MGTENSLHRCCLAASKPQDGKSSENEFAAQFLSRVKGENENRLVLGRDLTGLLE